MSMQRALHDAMLKRSPEMERADALGDTPLVSAVVEDARELAVELKDAGMIALVKGHGAAWPR
jgi:hypothetical protein